MDSSRPRSSGFAAPRRVFTAPVPPSAPQSAPSSQSAGGLVDTLYDHPNVKIVSFTAGARSLTVGPRAAAAPDIEPGSLSWSSQLERTIAVGPFRIYRAPGSVAFLSCGSALQPILPKSQVWCVDEESSKFVLQIRRPQYWRIEVPVEEQEDLRRARQLREVFDAILQFEKTECPFKRSFTVELPERPQTPVKKRPWTPARRSSASLPLTPVTPVEIARLHEGTPRGSICMGDLRTAGDARRALTEQARSLEPPVEEPVSAESDQSPHGRPDAPSLFKPAHVERSPKQVPLIVVPQPRKSGQASALTEKFKSPSESAESFVGREAWLATPLPPSPPISTPGSPRSSAPQLHTHDLSEAATQQAKPDHTVTSKPSQTWSVIITDSLSSSECSAATAPSSLHDFNCSLTSDQPAQPTDTERSATPTKAEPHAPPKPRSPSLSPSQSSSSSSTRGRSATTSTLSALPPPTTLLTPSHRRRRHPSPPITTTTTTSHPPTRVQTQGQAQGALAAVRRLPLTVLHKTCEILMSPPSHLIGLMLKVAARIAAGEWRGLVFGLGEAGERVSVAWDWSDDDDYEYEHDYDFEQDRRRGVKHNRGAYDGRTGGGGIGWGSGFDGVGNGRGWNNGGEVWSRGRERGKMKMAGAFPESDEEEEEEEEVGPLDVPRASNAAAVAREESRSPGRGQAEDEADTAAAIKGSDRPTNNGVDSTGSGEQHQGENRADAQWGVD